jgi:hypothetical protein
MPKVVKVLLLLALGGVLFLCAVGGAGALWWKRNKAQLIEASTRSMEKGEKFGAAHSDAECVDEALQRLAKIEGLTGEVPNKLFLSSCLKMSRDTPGFCQGVPKTGEILSSVKWQLATCAKKGHLNDQRCSRLLDAIQAHCVSKEQ